MPADGGGNELCMAAGVLGSVAGSPHAAHKLLSAHSSRLRSAPAAPAEAAECW